MWFNLKQIWRLKKQHLLTIICDSIAITLLLITNVISSNINQLIDKQITDLGLDVLYVETSYTGWHNSFKQRIKDIEDTFVYQGNIDNHLLLCVDDNFFSLFNIDIPIDKTSMLDKKGVVLSKNILSDYNNPNILDLIDLNGMQYVLIGVIDDNDNVYFDFSNSVIVINDYNFDNLTLQYYFKSDSYVSDVLDELIGNKNYTLINQKETASAFMKVFEIILDCIEILSVISSCICFLFTINHMRQTVLLRNYEIALKKSLGASKLDIYKQFIIESVCICTASVLIAVCIVSLIAWLTKMKIYSGYLSLIFVIEICGFVIGLLPAKMASKIDVIKSMKTN